MELDAADLSNLQLAWNKPEVRESLCKAILLSIKENNLELKVTDTLAIFAGIDSLVLEEDLENKQKNHQV